MELAASLIRRFDKKKKREKKCQREHYYINEVREWHEWSISIVDDIEVQEGQKDAFIVIERWLLERYLNTG